MAIERNQICRNRPLWRWSPVMAGVILLWGAAGRTRAVASGPLVTLGAGAAPPGRATTLSISVASSVTNVAGLDLTLKVTASPPGAPPLVPTFSKGVQAQGWQTFSSPGTPWRYTVYSTTGISGPAELMKLNLRVDPTAAPGTVYTLEAQDATLSDDNGHETRGAGIVSSGRVSVVDYGDLDGNGTVDATDLNTMLHLFVGLRPATELELAAGDTQPRPGANGSPMGDGLLQSDDLNWLFRRFLNSAG